MPGSSIEKTIRQGPLALKVMEGPRPDGQAPELEAASAGDVESV